MASSKKGLNRSSIEAYVGIIGGFGIVALASFGIPVHFGLGAILWAVVAFCLIDLSWRAPWMVNRSSKTKWASTVVVCILSVVVLTKGWSNTHLSAPQDQENKPTANTQAQQIGASHTEELATPTPKKPPIMAHNPPKRKKHTKGTASPMPDLPTLVTVDGGKHVDVNHVEGGKVSMKGVDGGTINHVIRKAIVAPTPTPPSKQ
jgi:hypothetical protein